jgi:hypothetical protein
MPDRVRPDIAYKKNRRKFISACFKITRIEKFMIRDLHVDFFQFGADDQPGFGD